jgi:hypothetical protein
MCRDDDAREVRGLAELILPSQRDAEEGAGGFVLAGSALLGLASTSQEVSLGSVTATAKDKVLVAGGAEMAEVTCQVSGTSSFVVTGAVSVSGQGVQISIPKIDSSATKMAPTMGSAVFNSKDTGNAYKSTSDDQCAFYFTQGTSQGVASGKIWVSFACPKVFGGMSTCEIAESFVIFENCTE